MAETKCGICGGNLDGHFHVINGVIVYPEKILMDVSKPDPTETKRDK